MEDSDSPDAAPTPGTLTRAVTVRRRHDGWTPQKQHDFIQALAESGCVTEAAAAVGMKVRSAYRLRARPDASAFRQSWDIALDYAIRNLSDAAFSRALHGVVTPIFYQGEQVGECRRFDERLTMFLLRYRDPVRYGAWLDGMEARRHPDGAAVVLANALNVLLDRAHGVKPEPPAPGPDNDHPPRLDPALAEGPQPPPAETFDWDVPPDMSDPLCLKKAVEACRAAMEEEMADDGPDADWRNPFLTRTPRITRL